MADVAEVYSCGITTVFLRRRESLLWGRLEVVRGREGSQFDRLRMVSSPTEYGPRSTQSLGSAFESPFRHPPAIYTIRYGSDM